ncbi:MAG: hypothetical protein VYE22_24835 [Myxococcota bacterium]|nr:hypothetical protein [Myxococcota bacterium]
MILVGDPSPPLRALAARVDASLTAPLSRPFDPGLRRALRGEPGEDDDGLSEIRRERRRLGLGETHDAPILAQLGRRAGARAVAVVRLADDGPELVVLDVRARAFYEGRLQLTEDVPERRVARFVGRRARVTTPAAPSPAEVAAESAEARPDPLAPSPEEEEGEPGFFEQYWPYFAAALLLGGMITAIAVTSAADAPDQPVLRFVPGGR